MAVVVMIKMVKLVEVRMKVKLKMRLEVRWEVRMKGWR